MKLPFKCKRCGAKFDSAICEPNLCDPCFNEIISVPAPKRKRRVFKQFKL